MSFYHPFIPFNLHGKTLVVVSVITSLAFKEGRGLLTTARKAARRLRRKRRTARR